MVVQVSSTFGDKRSQESEGPRFNIWYRSEPIEAGDIEMIQNKAMCDQT